MKYKHRSAFALILSLFLCLLAFTGCNVKYKVSEADCIEALETAYQYDDMTIKMTFEQSMYGLKYKASINIVVQGGDKYKVTVTQTGDEGGSYPQTCYYYREGDSWYLVQKNDRSAWVASIDRTFTGLGELIEDFDVDESMFEDADEYSFDDLVFRRGRYYYSDEMLNAISTEDERYEYMYIGFTNKKLSGIGMKLTNGDNDYLIMTMSIAYKGSVAIPHHTKAQ